MGERSDEYADSIADGLEGLGLSKSEHVGGGDVSVIVGDVEKTFKCERELLSRGCGYFKVVNGRVIRFTNSSHDSSC